MKLHFQPLLRGLGLILAIAVVLLLSDWKNRNKNTNLQKLVWSKKPGERVRINIILYNDSPVSEETAEGFMEGFSSLGWIEGKDFEVQSYNGQGDIATLNTIIETVSSNPPDLIYVATTPVSQAVAKKITDIPVFFATVADPVSAGLGTDFSHHRPNISGISTMSAFDEMLKTIRLMMPTCQTLGTLYCPTEANSVVYEKYLREAAGKQNIKIVAVPANTSSEVADAALAMVNSNVDGVCQLSDNLSGATYPYIIQSASKKGIPYFSFTQSQADKGAALTIARDYRQAGMDAVKLSLKYMDGQPIKNIPFEFVSKTEVIISRGMAEKYNLNLSPEILGMADKIIK